MTKETQKIIDKLAKIKAKADNAEEIGNIEEAEVFASKMQELMRKFQISMTDIEFAQHVEEPIIEQEVEWEQFGWSTKLMRYGWVEELARIVSKANGCDWLKCRGSNWIWMVGHKTNAEIACYTLGILCKAVIDISTREYRRERSRHRRQYGNIFGLKGFQASWRTGFIARIRERFDERSNDPNCTSLIRIGKELIRVNQYMVDKYDGKGIPQAGQRFDFNEDGYQAGKAFADGMDLDGKAIPPTEINKSRRLK